MRYGETWGKLSDSLSSCSFYHHSAGEGGYYHPSGDVLGHHQSNFFSCHHRYVRTFWCYILLHFPGVFEHVL